MLDAQDGGDHFSTITNFAGEEIDFLTLSAGYTQIINKPTHVINKSRSCIDLIFCTNQNVIKHVVDASLFDKCHHNILSMAR